MSKYLQKEHLTPLQLSVAKIKGAIGGAFKPITEKLVELSPSFQTLMNVLKKVKRNVRIAVNKTVSENPDASKMKAKINGIKKSKPVLKNALHEIVGVYDIEAAIVKKGDIAGIKEAGKAVARMTSSLGLFAIGNFVPVPGASVVGWVAGEKLIEKCLGKPFTKQAKNIISQ